MKKIIYLIFILSLAVSACGTDSSDDDDDDNNDDDATGEYTAETLATYKNVLPDAEMLSAWTPGEAPAKLAAGAVGGDVELNMAEYAIPLAKQINGVVADIVGSVSKVADLDPSYFDSENHEFYWGPLNYTESPEEGDTISLYIKDNGEESAEDYRYIWAILRGVGSDLETMQAVIWGGANPRDGGEQGDGAILWDFEANTAWLDTYYPEHALVEQGRFAAVYERKIEAGEPATTTTFVVARMYDFLSPEMSTDIKINFRYLYGNHTEGETRVDFADFSVTTEILTADTFPGNEELNILIAGINLGAGRAEGTLTNENLIDNSGVATQCWDAAHALEYYEAVWNNPFQPIPIGNTVGEAVDCTVTPEMMAKVPTLDDVPAELLSSLDEVAENGVPAK